MDNHLIYLEIGAILTGLIVIGIETYIILVLKTHVKILDNNLKTNMKLIEKFEKGIYTHLEHLNEHSHIIETMLKQICDHDMGVHDQNSKRLNRDVRVGAKLGDERRVPIRK